MSNPDTLKAVADEACAYAASIGVELHVDCDEVRNRVCFMINRNDAPKGSGAKALRRLVDIADAADVEVSLDVKESEPRLVRYYWRFGFRLSAGDARSETTELSKLKQERERFLATNPRMEPVDFGVVTMWRDRWAKPLIVDDVQGVDGPQTAGGRAADDVAKPSS
jgi:hypothetical protein